MTKETDRKSETSSLMGWTAIGVIVALVQAFILSLCCVMADMTE